MKVVIRPAAERDLVEAASWYEDERRGLGERFLREVRLSLGIIGELPRAYAILRRTKRLRRCRVVGFPYSIYFWIEGGMVVVVAVLHGARHPRTSRSRR